MTANLGQSQHVLWLLSVFAGIIMCRIVYGITGFLSSLYIREYVGLKEGDKMKWNIRGFSSFHAILVSSVSFYLVFYSNHFIDSHDSVSIVYRRCNLSDTMFGISLGYFISDLAMILWLFPAFGGKEYESWDLNKSIKYQLLHHGISIYTIALALISGEGHVYILMVMISESTTPFINLRWYLDIAGHKSSKLYLYNGFAIFFMWLVGRIILFIYIFTNMYQHLDEVRMVLPLAFYSLLFTFPVLAAMNLYWFWRILHTLLKTVSKKKHVN